MDPPPAMLIYMHIMPSNRYYAVIELIKNFQWWDLEGKIIYLVDNDSDKTPLILIIIIRIINLYSAFNIAIGGIVVAIAMVD